MIARRGNVVRPVSVAALTALLAVLLAAPASAAGWNVDTVVPARAFDFAAEHNAAVGWNNQTHVFYSLRRLSDTDLHQA